MTTEREVVLVEARTWLGTPFHDRADVRGHGVDCLHLIVRVYQAVGLLGAIDIPVYSAQWFEHRGKSLFLEGVGEYCHEVTAALPGDIVMYTFGRFPSHGGIVETERALIHAWKPGGFVMRDELASYEHRRHSYWRPNVWKEEQ